MRILRRPRVFGVLGVCLGPLTLAPIDPASLRAACLVAAFGAASAAALVSEDAAFASAITIPYFRRDPRARKPGPVLVHAARCRPARFPDAPCGAGGCW